MLDDVNEYISGFVVEDIHQLIAGHEIYDFEQFKNFIMDVVNHNDKYKEKRIKVKITDGFDVQSALSVSLSPVAS